MPTLDQVSLLRIEFVIFKYKNHSPPTRLAILGHLCGFLDFLLNDDYKL